MLDEWPLLVFLLLFDLLAFAGLRLSFDNNGRCRRIWLITVPYWLASLGVLGAAIACSFATRGSENEPQLPQAIVTALLAIYLPKAWLALLVSLEFARRGLMSAIRWSTQRVRGARRENVQPGWLTRNRLLPRIGFALAVITLGAIVRHWGGLYRSGRQYLNVNRGVGYVILPFRLNMPAEVSVIVVRSSRTAGSRT